MVLRKIRVICDVYVIFGVLFYDEWIMFGKCELFIFVRFGYNLELN